MKSFDSRSAVSTTVKSSSAKHHSRHASADVPRKTSNSRPQSGKNRRSSIKNALSSLDLNLEKGQIEANEDNGLYKEIILRQHDVPLADLLQAADA